MEYGTDVESTFRAQANPLGQDVLRPGIPQAGSLVFDILATDSPTALEFKGDLLSEPATIPLG
jgi:hypothetical protein